MTGTIQLNEQQQAALDAMLDFIDSDDELFTLKGYAGTGKTTTIQFLLAMLNSTTKVVFTAPTHKAVKVLRTMAQNKGIDVDCMTIHSLLRLTVKYKGDKQVLTRQKGGRNLLPDYQLVVVDECSMINTELYDYIRDSLKYYDVKYIFMGDPAQLPPVGEPESPVFEQTERRCQLTQVMRQRGENPVLGVCTDIREAFSRGDHRLPAIQPGMSQDGHVGVSVLQGALWQEWMPTAFSHDLFDADPDRFRIIAWRNETVNRLNDTIHQIRYPDCKNWLAEGEPVTFVKPLINRSMVEPKTSMRIDEIVVNTDFEGRIVECARDTHESYPDIPCWRVCCVVESGQTLTFYALDSHGLAIRNQVMAEIAAQNRAMQQSGSKKATWWPYYELQQSFAEIRPAYCLTAHKSQGSTFENVFVDVEDIWRNPNKSEAMRCLYVAASRASCHLIINQTGMMHYG